MNKLLLALGLSLVFTNLAFAQLYCEPFCDRSEESTSYNPEAVWGTVLRNASKQMIQFSCQGRDMKLKFSHSQYREVYVIGWNKGALDNVAFNFRGHLFETPSLRRLRGYGKTQGILDGAVFGENRLPGDCQLEVYYPHFILSRSEPLSRTNIRVDYKCGRRREASETLVCNLVRARN